MGRVYGGHDIAVYVATSCDGVEQRLVDPSNAAFEVALNDAVQLKGLPRGQLDGAVCVAVCQGVHAEVLLRSATTAGYADTDHEDVVWLELGALPLFAQVTIILLINAVKLGQLGIIIWQCASDRIRQAFLDSATQVVAGVLN